MYYILYHITDDKDNVVKKEVILKRPKTLLSEVAVGWDLQAHFKDKPFQMETLAVNRDDYPLTITAQIVTDPNRINFLPDIPEHRIYRFACRRK